MKLLDKFDTFVDKFSKGIEWIGVMFFLAMMVITTLDVLGAKLFLMPVPGSLDMMMMAQLIGISFAIASALILGRHIQVEFLVVLFPKSIQYLVDIIANLLGLILFVVIAWQLYHYGIYLKEGNEVSPTISLPLFPFALGAAFACIPVILVYLSSSLKSILKVFKI